MKTIKMVDSLNIEREVEQGNIETIEIKGTVYPYTRDLLLVSPLVTRRARLELLRLCVEDTTEDLYTEIMVTVGEVVDSGS